MKLNIFKAIIIGLGAIAIAACSESVADDPQQPTPPAEETPDKPAADTPIVLSRAESEIITKQNSFASNFFKQASILKPEGNMMLSPLSVSMTMSMIANAAASETRSEILDVLGFDDMNITTANALNARLISELPSVDRSTSISLANSAWIDNSLTIKDSFKEATNTALGAEIFYEALSGENAQTKINSWASEKTDGMIPEFLNKPLDSNCVALLNALCFKGYWADEFNPANTCDKTFHNADGSESIVAMMHNPSTRVRYLVDDKNNTWIRLYFGNKSYRIDLILPEKSSEINSSISCADYQSFAMSDEKYCVVTGELLLPKFKLDTSDDTIRLILEALGIKKAFQPGADFSAMTDGAVVLGGLQHKTTISFDEKGAEAAGVTEGDFMVGSDIESTPQVFEFNRPFAFILSESSTGAVLFTGRISGF